MFFPWKSRSSSEHNRTSWIFSRLNVVVKTNTLLTTKPNSASMEITKLINLLTSCRCGLLVIVDLKGQLSNYQKLQHVEILLRFVYLIWPTYVVKLGHVEEEINLGSKKISLCSGFVVYIGKDVIRLFLRMWNHHILQYFGISHHTL